MLSKLALTVFLLLCWVPAALAVDTPLAFNSIPMSKLAAKKGQVQRISGVDIILPPDWVIQNGFDRVTGYIVRRTTFPAVYIDSRGEHWAWLVMSPRSFLVGTVVVPNIDPDQIEDGARVELRFDGEVLNLEGGVRDISPSTQAGKQFFTELYSLFPREDKQDLDNEVLIYCLPDALYAAQRKKSSAVMGAMGVAPPFGILNANPVGALVFAGNWLLNGIVKTAVGEEGWVTPEELKELVLQSAINKLEQQALLAALKAAAWED